MARNFSHCAIKAESHITSKLHVWKKYYSTLSTMMTKSGLGWDDSCCMVTVEDDNAWDDYVKRKGGTDAFKDANDIREEELANKQDCYVPMTEWNPDIGFVGVEDDTPSSFNVNGDPTMNSSSATKRTGSTSMKRKVREVSGNIPIELQTFDENEHLMVANRLVKDPKELALWLGLSKESRVKWIRLMLAAFEINHFVKQRTRGKEGHFALKLDMSKAYDRVEWDFLRAVLCRLGIHKRFARCVQLYAAGGRAEGGDQRNCYFERGTAYLHLLFADDTIIFGQVGEGAMSTIRRILSRFGEALGQEVNFEKSSMMVSRNIRQSERQRLADILSVVLVTKYEKYLGLPAVAGRSRGELFQGIKDRIWSRVQGWNAKLLLQAGRAVLIKSVLQLIPTYVMSCFRLSDYFLRDIDAMLADFWWHSKG
ncbi:UNVERIFIED_CONTAM: hypothetical protein Slati_2664300 [Sesamum latifolium]|uniref:Reverse transcriptase n=1 Tax=Sesamum latifolium TaxID=2727402 RepID=A0AAW2VV10_9LAMI